MQYDKMKFKCQKIFNKRDFTPRRKGILLHINLTPTDSPTPKESRWEKERGEKPRQIGTLVPDILKSKFSIWIMLLLSFQR